ncbi:hypothetical protein J5X84_42125 [Streptosporangiaceae bacterium NEAU-GS5]|nr:hypothetical protein [Streptosporangiaceae bacterium NEAU-GS5]
MTDPDEMAAWADEPAFLLEEGIAYVKGWARAQHAASALVSALEAIGHPDVLPYLRADVNVTGAGFVDLGRVTPETAALLAEALCALARSAGQQEKGHAA